MTEHNDMSPVAALNGISPMDMLDGIHHADTRYGTEMARKSLMACYKLLLGREVDEADMRRPVDGLTRERILAGARLAHGVSIDDTPSHWTSAMLYGRLSRVAQILARDVRDISHEDALEAARAFGEVEWSGTSNYTHLIDRKHTIMITEDLWSVITAFERAGLNLVDLSVGRETRRLDRAFGRSGEALPALPVSRFKALLSDRASQEVRAKYGAPKIELLYDFAHPLTVILPLSEVMDTAGAAAMLQMATSAGIHIILHWDFRDEESYSLLRDPYFKALRTEVGRIVLHDARSNHLRYSGPAIALAPRTPMSAVGWLRAQKAKIGSSASQNSAEPG